MRAIVLSGGGSKGAWGVGVVKALMEQGHVYEAAVGTSTGSLMAPFILAEDIANLELGYTSVTQSSIFSKNPFKENGSIRKFKVGTRLIDGKKTFGESDNLRDLIERLVTKTHFDKIRTNDRRLAITVANLNNGKGETKSNLDLRNDNTTIKYSDAEMRDWIWASSNNPLFMSDFVYMDPDTLEAHSYADGGVTSYANIEYVLNRLPGIKHIDVIFHNTPEVITPGYDINNKVLSRLFRIIDMQSAEINKNDLTNARLRLATPSSNHVKMDIYYMSDLDITSVTGPSRNSLIFDKQNMQIGVMRGYTQTKEGTIRKDSCTIDCNTGEIKVDKRHNLI